MQNIICDELQLNGNWRAIVEDNEDPLGVGRVRVRILGIHSLDPTETPVDHLPWAEPCLSMYYSGGANLNNTTNKNNNRYSANENSKFSPPKRETETFQESFQDTILKEEGSGAIFTTPKKGAMVWVFFDCGSHTRPQYWAIATKSDDWIKQREKISKDIETKNKEIDQIRNKFNPDTNVHKGTSCSQQASVQTKINKPKLKINQLTKDIKNHDITSFTSPGGVTYIIVNTEGKESTYIIHKGCIDYTDENGQRKIVIGQTNNKDNDLEQTIANNFELHIGGDFDVYIKKSHYIQVDGDSQIIVNGNAGIVSKKGDIDLIAEQGSINLDAKKNINFHSGNNIQSHAEKNVIENVDSGYYQNVQGAWATNVKLTAQFQSSDMHLKALMNQTFQAGLTQTNLCNIGMTKAKTLLSLNGEVILKINAGAAIQQSAAAIDLGAAIVNAGGVVNMGSAASSPAPQAPEPTTSAQQTVDKQKFDIIPKQSKVIENPSN